MVWKVYYWRQVVIEFDFNILVYDLVVALEFVLRGGGGGQRRVEKFIYIFLIFKGKFDSSYRIKEGEIEVKEN